MTAQTIIPSRAILAAVVSLLLVGAGCRQIPVIEPELSDETVTSITQRGTPALWDEAWRVAADTGQPHVGMLNHGDEALALWINLIRSARESIRIQTFVWKNDESGRLITWELLRAVKQRGVRVQILADHLVSSRDVGAAAFLATFDPRLELKAWGPIGNQLRDDPVVTVGVGMSNLDRVNARMHNKLLLIDDRIAITGGRNVANTYFDRVVGMNFKDRDILVIGSNVEDAVESFDAYWNATLAVPCAELKDVSRVIERGKVPRFPTRTEFALNNLFPTIPARADDPQYVQRTFIDTLFPVQRVEWITDHADKPDRLMHGALGVVALRLLALIKEAEDSVLIQSPYLVFGSRAIKEFRALRDAKPELAIVISTNSLAATDAWSCYAVSYRQKRVFLQDLGMTIWESRPIPQDIHHMMAYTALLERKPSPTEVKPLQRPEFRIDPALVPYVVRDPRGRFAVMDRRLNQFTETPPYLSLHAKSLVVDDAISFVGSYNLSPRSALLNTENGVLVYDRAFATALRREIERDIAPRNSYLIAPLRYLEPVDSMVQTAHRVSEALPIDAWPLRYAASFVLREGKEPVPWGHPDFYDHWRDVGDFPLVNNLGEKKLKALLFKTFGLFFYPFL